MTKSAESMLLQCVLALFHEHKCPRKIAMSVPIQKDVIAISVDVNNFSVILPHKPQYMSDHKPKNILEKFKKSHFQENYSSFCQKHHNPVEQMKSLLQYFQHLLN